MSTKVGLILGGAKCVFDDLTKAKEMFKPDLILGINDIITKVAGIDHVATMHPDKLPAWLEKRRAAGFVDPEVYWTTRDRKCPDNLRFEKIGNAHGGSGLLAIYVMLHMGYEKIVLAGVPMAPEYGHFFDYKHWDECQFYRPYWVQSSSKLKKVRSYSGWTREFCGEPTLEWLAS